MKKELTIGILFCDKDAYLLPNLIKNIKSNIKDIDYEIICYDNRNNTEENLELENITILGTGGGNIRQLAARKHIIENANGEFLWFIDADDGILPIDRSFYMPEYDVINFGIDEYYSYVNVDEGEERKTYCVCLWNKFIKTFLLKEAIVYVKDEDRVSTQEDSYYVHMAMSKAKSVLFTKKNIYIYNRKKSSCLVKDCSDKFDAFYNSFFGFKRMKEIYKEVFDDYTSKKYINSAVYFFLDKFFKTKKIDVAVKIFESITETFSYEEIKQMVENYCETYGYLITKKKFIDRLIKRKYGKDKELTNKKEDGII